MCEEFRISLMRANSILSCVSRAKVRTDNYANESVNDLLEEVINCKKKQPAYTIKQLTVDLILYFGSIRNGSKFSLETM